MDQLVPHGPGRAILAVITGSRDWTDHGAIWTDLYQLQNTGRLWGVMHGCARGADAIASTWASKNRVVELRYPADWSRYGRAAGPVRNDVMKHDAINTFAVKEIVVLAYPLGESVGTYDMIRRCERAGLNVRNRGLDTGA